MSDDILHNSNEGAFAALDHDAWGKPYMSGGLTKRELFAAMAMQGMCADPDRKGEFEHYATDAVRMADALLAALATPPEEK